MCDLEVCFGAFKALHRTNLRIESGEFFSFLGPSGCGKTTLLRTISGFQSPTSGHVKIGGVDMRAAGPNMRPTALIFQNLALFPLMSVAENIGYGLRVRGVARREREAAVSRLLDIVSLSGQGGKRIQELSGGQKQRVAIARALAVEPTVLLLDEPLSALDLKLRQYMRAELRAIQQRIGITFIYITHDQAEALAMSDRVAVMNAGRIEQVGSPRAIYSAPETPFVASFVGENNVIHGRTRRVEGGEAVISTPLGDLTGRAVGDLRSDQAAACFIRPEALAPWQPSHGMGFAGEVVEILYEGNSSQVTLQMPGGEKLVARVVTNSATLPAIGAHLKVGCGAADGIVMAIGDGRP